jgi:hypothetical protein
MFILNGVELTVEQFTALPKLLERGWQIDYSSLHKLPAEQCVMVRCTSPNGGVMYFGIEPDGYTHS